MVEEVSGELKQSVWPLLLSDLYVGEACCCRRSVGIQRHRMRVDEADVGGEHVRDDV